MNQKISRTSVLVIAVCIAGAAIMGCSSPTVKFALAEEGRVGTTEHWAIELVDPLATADPLQLEKAGLATRSKYGREDKANKFLVGIRHELIRDHGLSFAENYPSHGTIRVTLRGSKPLSLLTQSKDNDPLRRELYQDLEGQGDHRSLDSLSGEFRLIGDGDKVIYAQVEIVDHQGRPAGFIEVTGNMKPKHVARAINEFLEDIAVK